jgi:orotidine-5'-phosphate decarboxylase
MTFVDGLESASKRFDSIVCMGCDPELKKVPIEVRNVTYDKLTAKYADTHEVDTYATLAVFYTTILKEAFENGCMPAAIKPNHAFWAQYGSDGLAALEDVIEDGRKRSIPVILDAKRGDIGKTSAAYAREVFDVYNADAVTVAPYMGEDSVEPFIKTAAEKNRGVYILCRTSNPGAADLQNLVVSGDMSFITNGQGEISKAIKRFNDEIPLYKVTARKICKWGEKYPGTVGAVVGATSPIEFEEIARYFVEEKEPPALLIPGFGTQTGSPEVIAGILNEIGYPLRRCRFNSSSGINFAYEKAKRTDWAQAAMDEIKKMNEEIGPIE